MRPRYLLAAILVASLVPASLAPVQPASGQAPQGSASVDVSLPTLAAPVSPAQPQNTSATVRYQWDGGLAQSNVTVELSFEDGPAWLNSSFTPSTVEFSRPQQSTSGVETRIVNITLDVSEQATAYEEGTATYQAQASSSGMLPAAQAEVELPLTAGFAGRLVAELPRGGNVTAWGGVVEQVPIELENTANGPIDVRVRVDRKPADARLNTSGTVRVGFGGANGTTTTHVEVRVPWTLSLEGDVEIALEPEHATRGTELRARTVGFQLEGNSAVPIPSPGPWAALAAVGLALIVRRR